MDGSTSGMAVDGSTGSCTLVNGTIPDTAWWRVNLTSPQEVLYTSQCASSVVCITSVHGQQRRDHVLLCMALTFT